MPLHIVRDDITKINCDAIVNAANNSLLGGGGVDGAIHAAAGEGLLAECKTLGGCQTGDAKVTKGYNLPCNYVIHTVGPIWRGGYSGEKDLLVSCYVKSLQLALQHNCETIAFPLISSGAFGYPREQAFQVAVDTIRGFLQNNEITVYLVIFDGETVQSRRRVADEVASYVDEHLVKRNPSRSYRAQREMPIVDWENINCVEDSVCCSEEEAEFDFLQDLCLSVEKPTVAKRRLTQPSAPSSLLEMLDDIDDNFAVTLLKLIDAKGTTDVDCYKRANVSKQTWYKIMNEKDYRPSKNTVISFAIALKLSLEETKHLLSTVGFALSRSSKFDIIIEYFIKKGIYDVFVINETLFDFDQVTLGV